MKRRRAWTLGAVCLLSLLLTSVAAPAGRVVGGSVIVSKTGEVVIRYLGHSATYSNDLYLESPPNSLGILFNNFDSGVGETKTLGMFQAGTELLFRLHVNDTGFDYYSGPASRNPDKKPHVIVDDSFSPTETAVYFEDLFRTPEFPGGFNDLGFSFTNVVPGIPTEKEGPLAPPEAPQEFKPSPEEAPQPPPVERPESQPPAAEPPAPPPPPAAETAPPAVEAPPPPVPETPLEEEKPVSPPPKEAAPPPKKPGDFYKGYFPEGAYRIGAGSSLSGTITEFNRSDSESAELVLNPSFGYFFRNNLELNFELSYSYSRVVGGGQIFRQTAYGLLVGSAYYVNAGEIVAPYFGGGVGWLHLGSPTGVPQIPASVDTGDGPQAKVYTGLKFLISPTWTFDVEAAYRRAFGDLDQEVFSGSFGFSVYFR